MIDVLTYGPLWALIALVGFGLVLGIEDYQERVLERARNRNLRRRG